MAPPSNEAVATAGIAIIVTIVLLVFWFSVAIILYGVIDNPDAVSIAGVTFVDYMSPDRLLIAVIGTLFLTALTWSPALKAASPD